MKHLMLFALMCIPFMLSAQSGWQIVNSRQDGPIPLVTMKTSGATAPSNAWLGSELLYELGEADFADNFLLRSRILVEITNTGDLHLPIMSNVEITSESPLSGVDIGIYPWQQLNDNFIAHGGVVFATNGEFNENALKVFGGFEFVANTTGLPLTVSVTPLFTFMNKGTVELETTIIVPVGNGLGLLAQANIPFKNTPATLQLGVVMNRIL